MRAARLPSLAIRWTLWLTILGLREEVEFITTGNLLMIDDQELFQRPVAATQRDLLRVSAA